MEIPGIDRSTIWTDGGHAPCALDVLGLEAATLSVVVLSGDECDVERLESDLDGLGQVASEVLVIDATTSGLGDLASDRQVYRPQSREHGGRMRTEADALVSGEWVLHLRFGEQLAGPVAPLLARLKASNSDAIALAVRSEEPSELVTHELRLVRQGRAKWLGCIDEVPVSADESRPLARQDFAPPVWIRAAAPSGCGASALDRLEANGADAAHVDADQVQSWLALAHRAAVSGAAARALEFAHLVIDAAYDDLSVIWAAQLVQALPQGPPQGGPPAPVPERSLDEDAVEFAARALGTGHPQRAANVLRAVVDSTADIRVQASSSHLSSGRAATLTALANTMSAMARYDEAARLLLRAAMFSPASHDLDEILATFEQSSLDFDEVVDLVHVDVREELFRWALHRTTPQSSAWLLRLAGDRPGDSGLLIHGARASIALGARHAFPWAVLVRERAVREHCPLRVIARSRQDDLTEAYLACLLLDTIFGEAGPLQRLTAEDVFFRIEEERVQRQLELLQEAGSAT